MNISSLRYHDRLADLLARFRLEFHAVLIDTPPVLKFADARLLGRLSDGVILVIRASETAAMRVSGSRKIRRRCWAVFSTTAIRKQRGIGLVTCRSQYHGRATATDQ